MCDNNEMCCVAEATVSIRHTAVCDNNEMCCVAEAIVCIRHAAVCDNNEMCGRGYSLYQACSSV